MKNFPSLFCFVFVDPVTPLLLQQISDGISCSRSIWGDWVKEMKVIVKNPQVFAHGCNNVGVCCSACLQTHRQTDIICSLIYSILNVHSVLLFIHRDDYILFFKLQKNNIVAVGLLMCINAPNSVCVHLCTTLYATSRVMRVAGLWHSYFGGDWLKSLGTPGITNTCFQNTGQTDILTWWFGWKSQRITKVIKIHPECLSQIFCQSVQWLYKHYSTNMLEEEEEEEEVKLPPKSVEYICWAPECLH